MLRTFIRSLLSVRRKDGGNTRIIIFEDKCNMYPAGFFHVKQENIHAAISPAISPITANIHERDTDWIPVKTIITTTVILRICSISWQADGIFVAFSP